MNFKFILSLVFCSVLSLHSLVAAPGTIRGKVTNGQTGEVLLGATVRLIQADQVKGGAYTDIEGSYTIKAEAGTYSMIISYVSFVNDTLEVTVEEGAVIYNETLLFESLATREDLKVEITAKRNQASTVTLYNVKRTSLNTMDGISNDLIKRTGDNDAASAMSRVTGVTVEGGKYVYIRGLGDRYSNTLLNGAAIPSLDPNRNAVQLDIFPSQLIDNIVVYKTFTPDLPANFSGGLVNVITKDFPDRLRINFSASATYNPQANLIDNFLTYETGKKDWQGRDDGTRALPSEIAGLSGSIPEKTFNVSNLEDINTINRVSNSFKTGMIPSTRKSPLGQNYQFSLGNQNLLFGRPFGYIASLSYRTEYNAYDDGKVARWKNTSSARDGVISDRLTNEREHGVVSGTEEVLWGGLVKLSYKPFDKHKIGVNLMHNQSGTSGAKTLEGPIPLDAVGLIFQTRVLSYLQRSIDIYQVQGDHAFGKLNAYWILSTSHSLQSEPDLRFFSNDYTINGETRTYDLQANLYPEPTRFFRDLDETNNDAKLNFELPVDIWKELQAKIKFGGAYTTKDRTFSENRYLVSQGNKSANYGGDPDAFFGPANTGVFIDTITFRGNTYYQVNYRNTVEDVSELRNRYSGLERVQAAYAMIELPVSERLKFVGGARYEGTRIETLSQDARVDSGNINLNDILPAISSLYKVREDLNLRGSFARTIARPTFREFAPFVSFDFVGDYNLVGNPNLTRTLIDNYDLRLEWYPTPGELISVSGFYKHFNNPIEKVLVPQAANTELTYRNVAEGMAYGVEFELRKNLGFIAPNSLLKNLQVGGNFSLIYSEVDIANDEYQKMIDVDPTRSRTRPVFGQSPYAVNGEVAYLNDSLGLKASLNYNVFGQRLVLVGGVNPDVYEQPRGLLNFSLSKTIKYGLSVTVRANNLLNPDYKQTQVYKETEYIFQNYRLGRSFSLGVSYSL
ncbi:MAG: TonB-dependent receptor [Bacteroidia bacterium]